MKLLKLSGMAVVAMAFEPLRLDFTVRRGNNLIEAQGPGGVEPPMLRKRDSAEMELTNAQTYYMCTLKFGLNSDEVKVLVDTGLSDLWVSSHDVNCLAPLTQKRDYRNFEAFLERQHKRDEPLGTTDENTDPSKTENKWNPFAFTTIFYLNAPATGDVTGSSDGSGECTKLGSFATELLNLWKVNQSELFYIQYADGTAAKGVWGTDRVGFDQTFVDGLTFAVANKSSSDVGVLGIGLQGLESTRNKYLNLPMKLKEQGKIAKNLYSLYLNAQDAKTGSILFGGVDHAKYEGDLLALPIVSLEKLTQQIVRLEVPLYGINLVGGNNQNISVTNNKYPALLDSGTTLTYLPKAMVQTIANALNADYSQRNGGYMMECITDLNAYLDFDFAGKVIRVPITDMQVGTSSSKYCMLGIMTQDSDPSSNPYLVLGDNFLRNAYIVYDLDDMIISMAQVKFTDEENIEVITSTISGLQTASAVTLFASQMENTQNAQLSTGSSSHSGSSSSDKKNNAKTTSVGISCMLGSLMICGMFLL